MSTSNGADPYAQFQDYWQAGWRGILPLPHRRKKPLPRGYSGHDGVDPSYADCQAWSETGPHNICLRVPAHVIGIDVDDYAGKAGGGTLARLVQAHGALPATWLSTSRDDGISGIRLYTIPTGVLLVNSIPSGIEIVQRHHRYIVCAPSIHPDTGRTYEWIDERTGEIGAIPSLDSIPSLPATWVAGLAIPGNGHKPNHDNVDLSTVVEVLPHGEPCAHILAAAGKAFTGAARHDSYNSAVLAVLSHARNGCPGSRTVINRLQAAFLAETTSPGEGRRSRAEAEGEWNRGLVGALQRIAGEPQGHGCVDNLTAWAIPGEGIPNAGEDVAEDPRAVAYRIRVATKAVEHRINIEARELAQQLHVEAQPPPGSDDLTVFLTQPDTDLRWRVNQLWPAGGRVLLAAAAKAGKTTLVGRNLLPALADGGKLLAHYDTTVCAGRIVYLNLEVSADQIRRWLRTTEISDTARVEVANLRGQAGRPAHPLQRARNT